MGKNWEKLGGKWGEIGTNRPKSAEIGEIWQKSAPTDPKLAQIVQNWDLKREKSGKRGGGSEGTAPVLGESIDRSIDRSAGLGSILGRPEGFPSLPLSFPAGFGAKSGDFWTKIRRFLGTHRGPEQSGRNRKWARGNGSEGTPPEVRAERQKNSQKTEI